MGQLTQFSASQTSSPHNSEQPSQSEGQFTQCSPSPHALLPQPGAGRHGSQSAAQVRHVSSSIGWHSPLPQQQPSCSQFSQLSPSSQVPLPHIAQGPQSSAHEAHVSLRSLHTRSPHSHSPQSCGQDRQLSLPSSQVPSGHAWQSQSPGQLSHDSLSWQRSSPHRAEQAPQSAGQVRQLSPPASSHEASGQVEGHSQSCAHDAQDSPADGWQSPSPHFGSGTASLG
jgi:hypothetical protein